MNENKTEDLDTTTETPPVGVEYSAEDIQVEGFKEGLKYVNKSTDFLNVITHFGREEFTAVDGISVLKTENARIIAESLSPYSDISPEDRALVPGIVDSFKTLFPPLAEAYERIKKSQDDRRTIEQNVSQ